MTVKSNKDTVHILGPGAMGLLWASHLARDNWEVTLLHKKAPATKTTPLHYQSIHGRSEYFVNQQTSTAAKGKLKTLLITVKANQLCSAIKPLLKNINPNTLIILTQNGIGSETELFHKFPKLRQNQVLQVVTSHSAIKHAHNQVQQTGFGFCWIGQSPKSFQQINIQSKTIQSLLKLKMVSGWRKDLEELTWQKLIINASINPLAAIMTCNNGELLAKPLLPLMKEVVIESCLIARKAGFENFTSDRILEKVKQVCRDTKTNKNSMLVDVINNRPTEIGYINQFLLDTANQLNMDAPWNLCLTSILNTINHVKMQN